MYNTFGGRGRVKVGEAVLGGELHTYTPRAYLHAHTYIHRVAIKYI